MLVPKTAARPRPRLERMLKGASPTPRSADAAAAAAAAAKMSGAPRELFLVVAKNELVKFNRRVKLTGKDRATVSILWDFSC
eukprot:SAG31_NODE_28992_length_402_cov_1.033003_1_plen_82_part_00